MKALLVSLTFIFLTGCATVVPVQRNFPEAPKELKESCGDLSLIPTGETKLSAIIKIIVENYGKYHECKIKNDSWIEWYNKQKEVFESVK